MYTPTFTEADVLRAINSRGLKHNTQKEKYILLQCPLHDDKRPSAQLFRDNWILRCNAGCESTPIQKVFPELEGGDVPYTPPPKKDPPPPPRDFSELYDTLSPIPPTHKLKNFSIESLNELGWRYDPRHKAYAIPYYDKSQSKILALQYRHLQGKQRFSWVKGSKPCLYGYWNLGGNPALFVVEGTSDAVTMQEAFVPWVAVTSAGAHTEFLALAKYCQDNDVHLIFAGDNDDAGNKLKQHLIDNHIPHTVHQPPEKYKDWSDYSEAEGQYAVQQYCFNKLTNMELL